MNEIDEIIKLGDTYLRKARWHIFWAQVCIHLRLWNLYGKHIERIKEYHEAVRFNQNQARTALTNPHHED